MLRILVRNVLKFQSNYKVCMHSCLCAHMCVCLKSMPMCTRVCVFKEHACALVCSSQKMMSGSLLYYSVGSPPEPGSCCFWLGWVWECGTPSLHPSFKHGVMGSCGCAQLFTWCWASELRPSCFCSKHSYTLSHISNVTVILGWLQFASWESDWPVCVYVWVYTPLLLKGRSAVQLFDKNFWLSDGN